MVKILISFLFLQVCVGFGAAAASAHDPKVSPKTSAGSVAASAGPDEQAYSPLEQKALVVLNSAYTLFEGKTFREMDDTSKAQFITDFMAAGRDSVAQFSVFEGLMQERFIDGFDRALTCLQKANSTLAKYMASFCILARVQGNKVHYQIPACAKDDVLATFTPMNRLTFVDAMLLTSHQLRAIFKNLIAVLDMKDLIIQPLSPYFAYCMKPQHNLYSPLAVIYATKVLDDVLSHDFNGEPYPDHESAYDYASLILFRQLRLYKGDRSDNNYVTTLQNFVVCLDKQYMKRNPITNEAFLYNGDHHAFLLSFLDKRDLSRYPKLLAQTEQDPAKRRDLLCSTFGTLEHNHFIMLAQDIAIVGSHPIIIQEATKIFKKANPSILEQQGVLLKKAYDLEQSDLMLVRLVHNCLMRNDDSLLPNFTGFLPLTSLLLLSEIILKNKADPAFYDALYITKALRDELKWGLDDTVSQIIESEFSPENANFPNLYRLHDARTLAADESFSDLAYLERLLSPVVEDQILDIQACHMLYDLSLRINNMKKALEYADKLHLKTSSETKTSWGEVKKKLNIFLNPRIKKVPEETSPEDQERAKQLLAQEQAREEAEHRAWVQDQLKLRQFHKQQHPAVKVQSRLNIDHLRAIECTLNEDARVTQDLENYIGPFASLKANYDRALDDLKNGRRPSDSSKYTGTLVKGADGKKYALWHCRLNVEHRVFYYKAGTDVYVIQAFGHDLDKASLPS